MRRFFVCFWRNLLLAYPDYHKSKRSWTEESERSKSAFEEELSELAQILENMEKTGIQRHQAVMAKLADSIEAKARANLLSMALGVTVLFSVLNIGVDYQSAASPYAWVRWPILTLAVIAVVYLLAGGLMALSALRLKEMYTPSLRDEAELDERLRDAQAGWVLEQNERTIWIRGNALSVSYNGIRNGVIVLAIAALALVLTISLGGIA